MSIPTFQNLRPCLPPGVHKFTVNHPPSGQWGTVMVICERCGMTREEAKS
jgi:hypothetical protein